MIEHKKEKIFNVLDQYLQFLNSIPAINYGGCGIAAYCLSKVLERHQMPKSKALMLFQLGDEAVVVRNIDGLYNSKINKLSSCSHVICENSGVFFDSCGEFPISDMMIKHKYILVCDTDELYSVIKHGKGWNCRFNREHYVPLIEEFFQLNLDLI